MCIVFERLTDKNLNPLTIPTRKILKANGFVQIAISSDLNGIPLQYPNRRVPFELEVIFNTPAINFANLSKVEMSVEDARNLVKEVFNIDLPSRISVNDIENAVYLTKNLPKSSLEKSFEFYQKATLHH
jgi:hypothetical protein